LISERDQRERGCGEGERVPQNAMPPIAMPIRLLSSRVNFAGAGPGGPTVSCTTLLGKGVEPFSICIESSRWPLVEGRQEGNKKKREGEKIKEKKSFHSSIHTGTLPTLLAIVYTQHTHPHPPHAHAPHVHVHSGPLVSFESDQDSYLEGPTNPRIVTGKQHSKTYVDEDHCTVNTFIHKHPNHLIVPLLHGRILLEGLPSREFSKEQYLGSLKT
jgi:hypothetical protein